MSFTKRQLQIVQRVAIGKLDKEIGDELAISHKTVKRHLHNIYQEMGFYGQGSRYQLIAYMFRNKLAA